MAWFGRETESDRQRAQAWARWVQRRHPYAIASAVVGLFSLIEFGALLIFGAAGIVLGAMALRQLRLAGSGYPHGHRLAWFGITTSAISLVIAAALYLRPFG